MERYEPFARAEVRVREHLAVVLPRYVESILAGRKTVEVRLSMTRCAPFGRVAPGDVLYFKQSGGPVRASATVMRVDQFEELTPSRVRTLARRYSGRADAERAAYWREKREARYATMIWFADVQPTSDLPAPRSYGAAWMLLDSASAGSLRVERGASARGTARFRSRYLQ